MITIIGPTASGKTQLATALAYRTGAEIISADSRQVYRRMDIGTGKDLSDYQYEDAQIPYHLIDICEPGEKYNVFRFGQDFRQAYESIMSRGRDAILCGGTGLYVESILRDYKISPAPQNPELRERLKGLSIEELADELRRLKAMNGTTMHNTTDIDTVQRAIRAIEIEHSALNAPQKEERQSSSIDETGMIFALDLPREVRRARITQRLDSRLAAGMVEEVRALLDEGVSAETLIYYGLEYKFLTLYVTGQITYQAMREQLEIAIHQFSKRQMTWFRGMERRGLKLQWLDATRPVSENVDAILRYQESH